MYVKVFSDIIHSSLWAQDHETKVVWITMLAISDRDGFVNATAPGIAKLAGVSLTRTAEILDAFQEPDPYSRTKEHEGRRIEETDGGFILLNYTKYRDLRDIEQRRASDRERQRRYRDSHVTSRDSNVTECDMSRDGNVKSRHTSASSSTDTEEKNKSVSEPLTMNLLPGVEKKTNCDGFDSFWNAYPRKTSKKRALQSWKLLKPDAALQKIIMDALEIQKGCRQWRQDHLCIPHPSTWLNQERWTDEPDNTPPSRPGEQAEDDEAAENLRRLGLI